jgi:DNA-binding NtrC family response regulator
MQAHIHDPPGSPIEGLARPGIAPDAPAVLYVQDRGGTEVERMLRALSAPVIRCASGREAIAIARIRPLACVVASLLLADMSATALIPALRQVAPGLAVIVILDNPEVNEAVAVMQAGAHAVVDSQVLSTGLFHHVAPLLARA